jgi:hypothetical protein
VAVVAVVAVATAVTAVPAVRCSDRDCDCRDRGDNSGSSDCSDCSVCSGSSDSSNVVTVVAVVAVVAVVTAVTAVGVVGVVGVVGGVEVKPSWVGLPAGPDKHRSDRALFWSERTDRKPLKMSFPKTPPKRVNSQGIGGVCPPIPPNPLGIGDIGELPLVRSGSVRPAEGFYHGPKDQSNGF